MAVPRKSSNRRSGPPRKSGGRAPYKSAGRFSGKDDERKDAGARPFSKRAPRKPFDKNKEGGYKKKREDGDERSFGSDKPAFKRAGRGGESNRGAGYGTKKPFVKRGDSDERPAYKKRPERSSDDAGERKTYKKPFERSNDGGYERKRSSENGDRPAYKKRTEDGGERSRTGTFGERKTFKKPFEKRDGDKPFKKRFDDGERGGKPFRKPFDKKLGDNKFSEKSTEERRAGGYDRRAKPGKFNPNDDLENQPETSAFEKKPNEYLRGDSFGKPFKKTYKKVGNNRRFNQDNKEFKKLTKKAEISGDGTIRLNRYIANAGICSRREADELIATGVVSVNGKIVTEMGYKVKPTDKIGYGGQTLKREKLVYILLNKPKDYIATLDDPQGRRTVFDLIRNACNERIYPVGRLDRNTTGLLLLTNDGELTTKLTHPKHGVRKIYQVTLDNPFTSSDMQKLADGIELEDGFIQPDKISYVADGSDRREVGIEIHSGRNRIVRRMFEALGYEVVKLDRVVFAGLTKKDLPRGHWRVLTEAEVGFLKMLG